MASNRVLVTGASGLVGSRIVELLQDQFEFVMPDSDELDITKPDRISTFLAENPVSYCLHLAAYTNVDGAETSYDEAFALNATGTQNLFEILDRNMIKGVLFSTDFVFEGQNPPFTEESTPYPISAYGRTKHAAEQAVGKSAMVVRISYPYRAFFEKKKDFVRTIIGLLEDQKQVSMISDASFTPTFIDDIALSLPEMLNNYHPETYHRVGTQHLSMYEAGLAIAHEFGLDASLISETSYDDFFAGKAARPRYSDITTVKPSSHQFSSFEEGIALMHRQQIDMK